MPLTVFHLNLILLLIKKINIKHLGKYFILIIRQVKFHLGTVVDSLNSEQS